MHCCQYYLVSGDADPSFTIELPQVTFGAGCLAEAGAQAQALRPPHSQGDVQALRSSGALEGCLQRPDRAQGAETPPLCAARHAYGCRREYRKSALAIDQDRALTG